MTDYQYTKALTPINTDEAQSNFPFPQEEAAVMNVDFKKNKTKQHLWLLFIKFSDWAKQINTAVSTWTNKYLGKLNHPLYTNYAERGYLSFISELMLVCDVAG